MTSPVQDPAVPPRWRMWPLYAAGFTTAFGAHGIAANLGSEIGGLRGSLLYLGLLLALYDGAEVVLKPVFGSIVDRIGARQGYAVLAVLIAATPAAMTTWKRPRHRVATTED